MKIRVIYDNKGVIISVDKPNGAAAIDYDKTNLAIDDHENILNAFCDNGIDVGKIGEFLLQQGVEIINPAWMPKPIVTE